MNELFGKEKFSDIVFPNHVLTRRTEKILLIACKICFLQALQRANEQFGYCCEFDGKMLVLRTNTSNERLLKDYRISYIKRDISAHNFKIDIEKPSFLEVVEPALSLIKREQCSDPDRYRLSVPEPVLVELCLVDDITQEELKNIAYEMKELSLSEDIYIKPIYKDLTFMDYIKLRRLFLIFCYTQIIPLYEMFLNGEISAEVYFRSVIPYINVKIFDSLREYFGTKIDTFIELSNYKGTNSKLIDLLYQPILPTKATVNDNYYMLCAIATISNIGRNLLVLLKHSNSEINEDGTDDPLIKLLKNSFDNAGIPNVQGKKLGKITDIDFAFFLDDTIFLAECKKNFHPTDIFECRTTIDAIYKAERQLDRISDELKSDSAKKLLLDSLNLKGSDVKRIIPFIITGNRIFSNTNEFKYPVRYFSELIRLIESGTMTIGEKEVYLREKSNLRKEDIDKFLSIESPYYKCFYESMISYQKKISSGKLNICIEDYALNIPEFDNYCRKMWNVSPINPALIELYAEYVQQL